MKLTFKYTSQIAMAAGIEEESLQTQNKILIDILKDISKTKSQAFNELLWENANTINSSILIIKNGDQVQDLASVQLNENDEIMLFSPMSGG